MSKPSEPPFEPRRPASNVRFLVVAVTAVMAVLLYLDRFCISFAETFIKEDLNLSDIQIGWVLSAFFWTYALAQVPSGWLTDRFGARRMLTSYILLWSLFTALTGAVFGIGLGAFALLLLLRMGFGVAQAGAYPTGASIISKWMPFSARGMASSTVAVGGRVGGFLALFITGYLIVMFVPTSVPSQLQPDGILDTPRFCYELQLAHTDEDRTDEFVAVDERLLGTISPAAREFVEATAKRYQEELLKATADGKSTKKAVRRQVSSSVDWSTDQRDRLIDDLNAIIRQRHFFSEDELRDLPLEREAKRLLERERSGLSQAEAERLNRLVLEAVYPQAVRKVYGAGWRSVMWLYGGLGLLVAGLFWWTFRNRPEQHPWVNKNEIELIAVGRPATAPQPHGKVGAVPLGRLLTSGSMWLVCVSQWCTNVGWVFIVTWAPRYFQDVHQVPVEQRALMVSIPPLVGWFGMLTGGWLTDRLVKVIGLRWGRALPMSLSRFTAMAAYVYCLWNPSPWSAVMAFSVVALSTDLGTGAIWAFKQDVGGRYVGSILGWGNMWGNLGAAITPPLLIWIVNDSARLSFFAWLSSLLGQTSGPNWNLAFLTCATAFCIAGIACLGVNATIPIAPKDEEHDEIDGKPGKP